MPRDTPYRPKPPLYYPTIVLSDLHLGKRKVVEANLILEFLENIRCDRLILNGDIIDGWYLEKHKHQHFPESHARVLDALNRIAAEGTEVIYLPGNHDERLRYATRSQMEQQRLKRAKPAFSKQVIFYDRRAGISCPYFFASDLIIKDRAGRTMQVLHGDVFDPPWVSGGWSVVGDQFYDALVIANTAFSELSKKFNGGTRFSFAKLLKKNTKDAVGIIKNFETAASSLPHHIDGLICGHIHHAEVSDNNGKLYVNSGDWVESCTAAFEDEKGQWGILHWEQMRQTLGLKEAPDKRHPNPNAEYRGVTRQQLRLAQYMWPAQNRQKLVEKVKKGKIKRAELILKAA